MSASDAGDEVGGDLHADVSPYAVLLECPQCGGEMAAEHAHYRCPGCGWRDSCCD